MLKKELGYVRVATAIPNVKVANVGYNIKQIKELYLKAVKGNVDIVVFPELSITGYTCQDLFHQETLLDAAEKGLGQLIKSTKGLRTLLIVGGPERYRNGLFNSAFVISNGNCVGKVRKTYLPGYKEFYEPRWFKSFDKENPLFRYATPEISVNFGIEICEDLWSPCPPSNNLVKRGAEIIFNLSATNELTGKHEYLLNLLKQQSARLISGYVYCSAGYGESSQDVVYAGNGIILENGKILAKSDRFCLEEQLIIQDIDTKSLGNERIVNTSFQKFLSVEDSDNIVSIDRFISNIDPYFQTKRIYNGHPFIPKGSQENITKRCEEILNIQTHALVKRIDHTNLVPVIGVSGGLDSTWALIVAHEAIKKYGEINVAGQTHKIIGVTMPGFATSNRTLNNSKKLMDALGSVESREIPIGEICASELKALNHPIEVEDITFENVQARMRTDILMNTANNSNGFVVGTGDISELALGWCTYNADQMSMYGINCSIPKTLIKHLIKWYAETRSNEELKGVLLDILDTPVSPELTGSGATNNKDAQKTESLIGPYELHDFFLYNMLRHGFGPDKILYLFEHSELKDKYSIEEAKKWLTKFCNRFFSQQFKRSNLPDGPKIGSISLSQRGDWRMPTDAAVDEWINSIANY